MPTFQQTYPVRANLHELEAHVVKFVGGPAAVTKTYGPAATVTYISAGVVDVTWGTGANKPGEFVGLVGTFQATTPGDVKSYVVVPGAYNATTCTLRLSMYESGTLTDLAALEWLTVVCLFSKADV